MYCCNCNTYRSRSLTRIAAMPMWVEEVEEVEKLRSTHVEKNSFYIYKRNLSQTGWRIYMKKLSMALKQMHTHLAS